MAILVTQLNYKSLPSISGARTLHTYVVLTPCMYVHGASHSSLGLRARTRLPGARSSPVESASERHPTRSAARGEARRPTTSLPPSHTSHDGSGRRNTARTSGVPSSACRAHGDKSRRGLRPAAKRHGRSNKTWIKLHGLPPSNRSREPGVFHATVGRAAHFT